MLGEQVAEGTNHRRVRQTVATQRLLPLGPSFGMTDEKYAALMNRSLRAMKALGLR